MRILFTLIFTALLLSNSFGQISETTPPDALLIRLHTKDRNIKALKEKGRLEQARELQRRQELENQQILKSARANFTFAPVYFFYAKDSKEVREGDFSKVLFDNQRNVVKLADTAKVMVAEFGQTPNMEIDGLLLMDQSFNLLDAPFPPVIRKYRFFSLIKMSKSKMLAELNKKLMDIYQ